MEGCWLQVNGDAAFERRQSLTALHSFMNPHDAERVQFCVILKRKRENTFILENLKYDTTKLLRPSKTKFRGFRFSNVKRF